MTNIIWILSLCSCWYYYCCRDNIGDMAALCSVRVVAGCFCRCVCCEWLACSQQTTNRFKVEFVVWWFDNHSWLYSTFVTYCVLLLVLQRSNQMSYPWTSESFFFATTAILFLGTANYFQVAIAESVPGRENIRHWGHRLISLAHLQVGAQLTEQRFLADIFEVVGAHNGRV